MIKNVIICDSLDAIKIVMVETSNPGNIGAAARAMKNMGLGNLRLVNPKDFPSGKATARASSATDILQTVQIYDSLEGAIADCSSVVATTARLRRLGQKCSNPCQIATTILNLMQTSKSNSIAIVFGRESSGLTNKELDLCQYLSTIPTSKDYSSLNIAAAIQVYCYEIFVQFGAQFENGNISVEQPQEKSISSKATLEKKLATNLQIEDMFSHLFLLLQKIGYIRTSQTATLSRRIRTLINKNLLTFKEIQILRGIYRKILQNLK